MTDREENKADLQANICLIVTALADKLIDKGLLSNEDMQECFILLLATMISRMPTRQERLDRIAQSVIALTKDVDEEAERIRLNIEE